MFHGKYIYLHSVLYIERERLEDISMTQKPTYEELEQRVKALEAALAGKQPNTETESVSTVGRRIAHDFNNMLMGIQGRASMMLLDVHPTHPHYEHLKGIEEYVKNAAVLTNRLLTFLKTGKLV
jgi:signal transduction histidine kinase